MLRINELDSLNENKDEKISVLLPKIIFADIHSEPCTGAILSNLASELEKFGYTHFLDEMSNCDLDQNIRLFKQQLALFEAIKIKMQDQKLDIKNIDDIFTYVDKLYEPILKESLNKTKTEKERDNEIAIVCNLAMRNEWQKTTVLLLESIKKNKINYEGADVDIKHIMLDKDGVAELKKIQAHRDQKMAMSYLTCKGKGIFGRAGLAHIEGIYKQFMEINPHQPPIIFYIYSNLPLPVKMSSQNFLNVARSKDYQVTMELMKRARQGKIKHIIPIDANQPISQIIDLIIQKIKAWQQNPLAFQIKSDPEQRCVQLLRSSGLYAKRLALPLTVAAVAAVTYYTMSNN